MKKLKYFMRDYGFVTITVIILTLALAVFGGYKLSYLNTINSLSQDSSLSASSLYIACTGSYEDIAENNISVSVILKSQDSALSIKETKAKFRAYDDGIIYSSNEKKSYHIKFEEAMNFLALGSARSFILLSCSDDKSVTNAMAALETAKQLGDKFVSSYAPVHLYINNAYLGLYLAVEQVQVGTNRVEIGYGYDDSGKPSDTENTDFLLMCGRDAKNETKDYTFTPDIVSEYIPTVDISSPQTGIITESDKEYIKDLFNNALSAIINGDEKSIKEHCDIDSLVNVYILGTLFPDADSDRLFYALRRAGEDKIVFTPYEYNSTHNSENGSSIIFDSISKLDFIIENANVKMAELGISSESITNLISSLEETYSSDIIKNSSLWNK